MSQDTAFRRIIVELNRGHHDERTLRFLAELADAYGMELSARYIIDPGPMQAAALPFNREFRMLEQVWHPLDQDTVMHAAELSASAIRRRFERVAGAHGVMHSFQLIAATEPAPTQQARRLESILVLGPTWDKAQPSGIALETAFEEAAGVLLLPQALPRKDGAIVVVAEQQDVALSEIGARLATHVRQKLVVLEPVGKDSASGLFGPVRERLIVVRRGLLDETALAALAARRGVAVLAIDR